MSNFPNLCILVSGYNISTSQHRRIKMHYIACCLVNKIKSAKSAYQLPVEQETAYHHTCSRKVSTTVCLKQSIDEICICDTEMRLTKPVATILISPIIINGIGVYSISRACRPETLQNSATASVKQISPCAISTDAYIALWILDNRINDISYSLYFCQSPFVRSVLALVIVRFSVSNYIFVRFLISDWRKTNYLELNRRTPRGIRRCFLYVFYRLHISHNFWRMWKILII